MQPVRLGSVTSGGGGETITCTLGRTLELVNYSTVCHELQIMMMIGLQICTTCVSICSRSHPTTTTPAARPVTTAQSGAAGRHLEGQRYSVTDDYGQLLHV